MIYLHANDAYESSPPYLIKKLEELGVKDYKDSKTLIEYFRDFKNFYKSTEDYNLWKEQKALECWMIRLLTWSVMKSFIQ